MGSAFNWMKEDPDKIIAAANAMRDLHRRRNLESLEVDGLFGDMEGVPLSTIEDAFKFLDQTESLYSYTILGKSLTVELLNINDGYRITIDGLNYELNFIVGSNIAEKIQSLDEDIKNIPGDYQGRLDTILTELEAYKVTEA